MIDRDGAWALWTVTSYAYDINSNRTKKTETVSDVTETINYTYNANDQLLSEVSSANGTTSYQYDANGSLTTKENTGKFSYQYGYNLRNRLASATITRKEGLNDVTINSSYAYNTSGIRTRAEQIINGITQNRYFLLDSGHTGYAQVFEETSILGGNVIRSYVLGDDVLSQNVGGATSHLLYDGHGSTRQLADTTGAITANYKYDAYGKMLGGDPNVIDRQSATDLLYAGEQFDAGLQMEYLRARYYDQNTGRFNRLDPFDGNNEDPQSLHKYAYAHCDPVNGVDPSGEFTLLSLLTSFSIQAIVFRMVVGGLLGAIDGMLNDDGSALEGALWGAGFSVVGPLIPWQIGVGLATWGLLDAGLSEDYDLLLFRGITLFAGGYVYRKAAGIKGGRLGNFMTRIQNSRLWLRYWLKGWRLQKGGNALPEEYVPSPGGGKRGGKWVDITLEKNSNGVKQVLRIQTADTTPDGITFTPREMTNAEAILLRNPGDHLLMIPKSEAYGPLAPIIFPGGMSIYEFFDMLGE